VEVFFAPLDVQPDRRNSLEPDVLVVRRDDNRWREPGGS